jgi:glyoxylase-like metal-dependent hydrolase (beta-lactamase superfamily II)
MKRRTDIEVEDLGNGLRRLSEFGLVNCYLAEGTERACLIDTGAGIADMAAVVRSLTDKPLTVLITHAHEDHLGGGVWFPEVYVHPADFRTAKLYFNPIVKMGFLHMQNSKRKSHAIPYRATFQRDYRPKLLPVNEGDTFDLGGRTIETYLTPGHSPGSLTFRDTETGALFVGDHVNLMTTLQFLYADTVAVWLQSAEKTLELAGDAPMYVGHGEKPLTKQELETLIGWGRELVAAGNAPKRAVKTKRGEKKYPCIVYRADRIE